MKYKRIIILCMILVVGISFILVLTHEREVISYDADLIKKLAYDYLEDDIKTSVVTSLDDYYSDRKAALNAEKIWLYGTCEEVLVKDLKLVLWVDEATEKKYESFKSRNKTILVVKFETATYMLESVGFYVDPETLKVVGLVVTY